MSFILTALWKTILDMDIEGETRTGEDTEIRMITSAVSKPIARLKSHIFSLWDFPAKVGKVDSIEELEKNPLWKEYKIRYRVPYRGFRKRRRR